jgi:hypothetical protein
MVEKIENEVITKHGMNRAEYEASFANRVDVVPELKAIEDYMVDTMNRAGNGSIVLPKVGIPEVLTPLKVFELLVESERAKIQKVAGVFADYIRAGQMPNEMDPAFNQKMEQAMGDNVEVPGLSDLDFGETEHHPLALFILAQTKYTQQNKDGFKIALQQFMQSVQLSTMSLANGTLNASNIDDFLAKLSNVGEAEIQRFRQKFEKAPEVTETPAEVTESSEFTKVNEETTETPAEGETTETPTEGETTETPAQEATEETTETPAEGDETLPEVETTEAPVEEETTETPAEEATEETTETPAEEATEETTETPAEEATQEEEGDAAIEEDDN